MLACRSCSIILLVDLDYNSFALHSRTLDKSRAAQDSILAQLSQSASATPATPVGKLIPMECNLASLASVRRFAADFQGLGLPLDVLVCNAGVALGVGLPPPPPRTVDGFELTVGTNHLGHFLLSCLLAPSLERAGPGSRLVVTASQVLIDLSHKIPSNWVLHRANLGTRQHRPPFLTVHPNHWPRMLAYR